MKIAIVLVLILINFQNILISEEYCSDYRLLNGYEKLVDAGMDTTFNWWAITAPFSNKYRLHVNGKESEVYDYISKPIFSYDGNFWAAFADAGAAKYLLQNDSAYFINCTDFGEILFPSSSEGIVYSLFQNNLETIYYSDKQYDVIGRIGKIYTNSDGSKVAFVIARGSYKVLCIEGKESTAYDEILPVGFWYDNSFLYAARSGSLWEIYRNDKSIGEKFSDITESQINLNGDVAAFICRGSDGWYQTILLSDDYREPLKSKQYQSASGLALHPHSPMFAFNAKLYEQYYVVFNSTEYASNRTTLSPVFTWNGDEMYFFSCSELNCYIYINGLRQKLIYGASLDLKYVHAPNSETYAFSTNTNMYMNFIGKRDSRAGLMVDNTTSPRYNRFEDAYESLGVINDKLYLLVCKVPR